MPCPCFEPTEIVAKRAQRNARLPLIEEYEGFCRATDEATVPPPDVLFRFCNHGYSRGSCPCFPSTEMRSALRYSITAQTETALEVICIEETDYAPARWFTLRYVLASGAIQPDAPDGCIAAQAAAFCRGYLGQLRSGAGSTSND